MPKTTKTKRVAIYGRVSTTHQDVQMQLTELRQVASQRGWEVVKEYVDEGISGSTTARPGLDRMMMDARRGQFDLLVVWKLDRLGRSLQHLLTILDELNGLNIGFVSVRDAGMDTTSAGGRLMLSLIGAFAEYERSLIRERVLAGVHRAQAQGKHCGRPKSQIDIRAIKALQSDGHSIREISEMLGVSRGTVWRRLQDASSGDGDATVSSITASA